MNARETVSPTPEFLLGALLFYRLSDGTPVTVSALRRPTGDEWRRLVGVIDAHADLGIMAELWMLRAQVRAAGEASQPGAVDHQPAQQMAGLKAEHEASLEDVQAQLNAVACEADGFREALRVAQIDLHDKDVGIGAWRKRAEDAEKQLLDLRDCEAAWQQAEHELEREVAAHKASLDKMEALQRRVSDLEGAINAAAAPVVSVLLDDEADAPTPDALVSEGEAVSIADAMVPVRVDNPAPEVDETPVEVAETPEAVAETAEAVDEPPAGADEPKAKGPATSSPGGVAPSRAVLGLEAGVRLRLPRSLFGIAEAMLAKPSLMAELAQLTASGNIGSTAASVSVLRREVKRQTSAAWAVVREGERYSLARVKPERLTAAPAPAANVEPVRPPAPDAGKMVRPPALKPLTGAVQIEPGDLIGVNIKTSVVAAPLGQYSLDGAVKMARSLDLLKGGQMFGLAHIATVGQWRDAEIARNALLMERGRLARHGIDLYVDKINARLRLAEAGAA